MARATLIPPPPGSRQAGVHRTFAVGITRSTVVCRSMEGFIVSVAIRSMALRPPLFLSFDVTAADLVPAEPFDRLDQRGMVFLAAVPGRTGVGEFLNQCRGRERHLQLPCSFERKIEVLLVEFQAETGLPVALEHTLAVDLQDARGSKSAEQGVPDPGGIGARLGGEHQSFAHGLDGKGHDDLIRHLAGLARPVLADQGDVFTHDLEVRPDLGEGLLVPPDHDREGALARPNVAPGDRRVQVAAALLVDLLSEFLSLNGRDGAHIDDDLALGEALVDAVFAEENLLHVGCVGHHGKDDVGVLGHFAGGVALGSSRIEQFLRDPRPALQVELVALLEQVVGHGHTHDPQSDEAELRHVALLLVAFFSATFLPAGASPQSNSRIWSISGPMAMLVSGSVNTSTSAGSDCSPDSRLACSRTPASSSGSVTR